MLDRPDASLSVAPIVLRRLRPLRVTGRVMWSGGQPAASLSIGAAAVGERATIPAVQSTRISDTGAFTLPLFEGAPFELTIAHERRIIYRERIVATDMPIMITLPGTRP